MATTYRNNNLFFCVILHQRANEDMVRNWSRQRCHSKVKHSEDLPRPSRNSLLWMLRTILFSRLTKFNFKLPIKNIEMIIGLSLTHFVSYRNRPSIRLASNVCYNFTVTPRPCKPLMFVWQYWWISIFSTRLLTRLYPDLLPRVSPC